MKPSQQAGAACTQKKGVCFHRTPFNEATTYALMQIPFRARLYLHFWRQVFSAYDL
jgi:hypothetical protein